MDMKKLVEEVNDQYGPKGEALSVAVLVKNLFLTPELLAKVRGARFSRSDRTVDAAEQTKAGLVLVSTNTATGFTRSNGSQPGFHDLRDALVGKKLGEKEAKELGRERQRGLFNRLGINSVKIEDVVYLKTEKK